MSSERYCAYGRHYKPDEGFKTVRHDASGTQRGMCPQCQAMRQKPRKELLALAEREREAKKGGRP